MFARVQNGVVMEIIDFNPEGRFTEEIVAQFIACPDETQQQWIYADGAFSAPETLVETIPAPSASERLTAVEAALAALMGV